MTLASATQHRLIANTALPYKNYSDITGNDSSAIAGSNVLSSIKQLSERRGGFADYVESSPTTFTALAREFKWSKVGGTRFFSMVCDVSGGVAKVYKYEVGVDTSYSLLFTSASANPFDFCVFDDILYYGNASTATSMRAWTGTGSDRLWGIVKPNAPTIGTSSTGISAFSGYYYRYTYCNSTSSHESSSSALSACTGIFTNKEVDVTVVASSDSQVDQIRIYRTTDGGSTAPSLMQEITGSPFTNASTSHADTTADGSLGTRTCPGTVSNDPPTPCSKFSVVPGRIFGAASTTVYFSGFEELNGFSRPAESWPSGITGNSYPFDKEVTSTAPTPTGVAIFTRGTIWGIDGDRRDNFRRYKLLERRGAVNHTNVASLGNSIVWFDTSRQMWLSDEGEIGVDIRTDLTGISPATASVAVHISSMAHWIVLLDGATGKILVYDLDTKQWMVPWLLQGATSASSLSSGENSAGNVVLTVAYNKTTVVSYNTSTYNDLGVNYAASITTSLLDLHPENNSELNAVIDYAAVETNAVTASAVSLATDDDPRTASYTDITANVQEPPLRHQGTNLVKKLYMASPQTNLCERASFKMDWAAAATNFLIYGIDIGWHSKADGR